MFGQIFAIVFIVAEAAAVTFIFAGARPKKPKESREEKQEKKKDK